MTNTQPNNDFMTFLQPYLQEETPLIGENFEAISLDHAELDRLDARQCTFSGCAFAACSLEGVSFTDVTFSHCDFSNSICIDSYFERCCFQNCRCIGTNFGGSIWKHTKAADSTFQYAIFDRGRMTEPDFSGCDFEEASLAECRLKHFTAKDCRFVRSSFFKTPLAGIDFSSGEFLSPVVSAPPAELKDITVNLTQAAGLAGLLGIHVKF
ncbi:MAG: pentapeptide repeat-containing protein [Oscillospiraceae bacterium]|jgi:uncharacterized protein YjbI with pentapeptide repeats|nr:pentapeptide repeat-containing protein [Oscillospiraceae bacterium]